MSPPTPFTRWLRPLAAFAVLAWLTAMAATPSSGADAAGLDPAERSQRPHAGFLLYSSQSVLQVFRLSYLHEGPEMAPSGTVAARAQITWSNNWNYAAGRYRADYESWYLRPMLRYVAREDVEVGLELPYQYITGGVLDGPIQSFHRSLHLQNANREHFPDDDIRMEIDGRDGSTSNLWSTGSARLARHAPVVSARMRPWDGVEGWPVAVKLAVDVPELEEENAVIRSEGRDWALGVSTAADLGDAWSTSLSLAYLRLRAAAFEHACHLNRGVLSAAAALGYALDSSSGLIFQTLAESPVTEGSGTDFDKPTTDVLAGWRFALSDAVTLETALIENLFVHENNVDFGVQFGLSAALR